MTIARCCPIVWHAHRDAANDTMIDSDNVLLLRPARPGSRFVLDAAERPGVDRSYDQGETESVGERPKGRTHQVRRDKSKDGHRDETKEDEWWLRELEERVGVRIGQIDARRVASSLHLPALVFHDREDNQVAFSQGQELARAWPSASLIATDGLGTREC